MDSINMKLDEIINLLKNLEPINVEFIDDTIPETREIPVAPVIGLGEGDVNTSISPSLRRAIRETSFQVERDVESQTILNNVVHYDSINIGNNHRMIEERGVLVIQRLNRSDEWETIHSFS